MEDELLRVREILSKDKFNLALMDIAGKQYDTSFQNVLQAILEIKAIVDTECELGNINNPHQEK